jgi:hypothetical protein
VCLDSKRLPASEWNFKSFVEDCTSLHVGCEDNFHFVVLAIYRPEIIGGVFEK